MSRDAATQPWSPFESGAAPQARFNRLQPEARNSVIEAPTSPTIQSFLSLGRQSTVIRQTAPRPELRDAEELYETPRASFGDRSTAMRDDHAPLPATSVVHHTEHVEHVIVEHEGTPTNTAAIGSRASADIETRRALSNTTAFIEPAEHVIFGQDRSTQQPATGPIVVTPVVSSVPTPPAFAPKLEPQSITTSTPSQQQVAEHVRTEADQASKSNGNRMSTLTASTPVTAAAKNTIRPLVTPIVERLAQVRTDSASDRSDRVSTAQRQQFRQTESRQAPLPQPVTPSIHVTIGRIEVRATLPSTSAKRASPPSSAMSLEDYLLARLGDKR